MKTIIIVLIVVNNLDITDILGEGCTAQDNSKEPRVIKNKSRKRMKA